MANLKLVRAAFVAFNIDPAPLDDPWGALKAAGEDLSKPACEALNLDPVSFRFLNVSVGRLAGCTIAFISAAFPTIAAVEFIEAPILQKIIHGTVADPQTIAKCDQLAKDFAGAAIAICVVSALPIVAGAIREWRKPNNRSNELAIG